MSPSKGNLRALVVVVGGCVLLTAGFVTAWVLFVDHGDPMSSQLLDDTPNADSELGRVGAPSAMSADEQLRKDLADASSDADKARVIEAVASTEIELGQVPYLRSCMTVEESEEVRNAAFRTALQLSRRSGERENREFLMDTVQNPHADVRRQALRECKGMRDPELVSLLVNAADNRASERFLVVDTLATMDDNNARSRVLAAAMDTKLPRAERLRAIALLSKTRTEDAKEYLIQVASSDDLELRRLAMETLHATQVAEGK